MKPFLLLIALVAALCGTATRAADAPNVANPEAATNVSLGDLRHWYLAPTNPAQLANAGIPFALTTDGLATLTQFLQQAHHLRRRARGRQGPAGLVEQPVGGLDDDRRTSSPAPSTRPIALAILAAAALAFIAVFRRMRRAA